MVFPAAAPRPVPVRLYPTGACLQLTGPHVLFTASTYLTNPPFAMTAIQPAGTGQAEAAPTPNQY